MLDFKIGHAEDIENGTGVTVIINEKGAVGGVCSMGGSPGTREVALLKSENTVQAINAIVLSGGSAFGIESTCGVMDYLAERKVGYKMSETVFVPIVCGAVLYDLGYKSAKFPDKKMGYSACEVAKSMNMNSGINVGAGCGATVGKILGADNAYKGGLGVAVAQLDELEVMAVVAVNSLGDIYNPDTNEIIAGAQINGEFVNSCKLMSRGIVFDSVNQNTVIGCVITNAKITKAQANFLAIQIHDSLALCVRPTHTIYDGDTIFTMASGKVEADLAVLGEMCVQTMKKAIIKSVNNG